MPATQPSSASTAPPIIFQADRIRRRMAASDNVAALVAELAFGTSGRDDLVALHGLTTDRTASYAGGRIHG